MMTPAITALYAIVFAVLMIVLSTHVTMLRASLGVSINDGGNKELALRMRRHGNFVENVPMIVLLMLPSLSHWCTSSRRGCYRSWPRSQLRRGPRLWRRG